MVGRFGEEAMEHETDLDAKHIQPTARSAERGASAFGDAFVEVEDGAGYGVPGGEFGGGEIGGQFQAGAELLRGFGVCFGGFELGFPEGFEDDEFLWLWGACEGEAEGVVEAGVEVCAR